MATRRSGEAGFIKRRGLAVKNRKKKTVLIQSTGLDPISDTKKMAAELLLMLSRDERVELMQHYRPV